MSWALARRGLSKSPSALALETLESWQEKEARNQLQSAVDEDGSLLDNLTLELRVHPPSVEIDNAAHERWTVVTIDSANRPGSLIYVRGRAGLPLPSVPAPLPAAAAWAAGPGACGVPHPSARRSCPPLPTRARMVWHYMELAPLPLA